jgi:hypothetical protein
VLVPRPVRRFTPIALCVMVVLLTARSLAAWNAIGHETIARIAWDNMTPVARAKAVALLRAAPPDAGIRELEPPDTGAVAVRKEPNGGDVRGRELFTQTAFWADIVRDTSARERRAKYHHPLWHYRDLFFEQDSVGGPTRDRPDKTPADTNAVERLGTLERELADASRSDADRAIALAWIIHLVGDIHQPLHASARITAARPNGDAGGNGFRLGERASLHGYWDNIISDVNPNTTGVPADVYIGRLASEIESRQPRRTFVSRLEPGQYDAWGRESFATTKRDLYAHGLVEGQEPPESYRRRAYAIAEPAAALAGYRLAELLNRILAR